MNLNIYNEIIQYRNTFFGRGVARNLLQARQPRDSGRPMSPAAGSSGRSTVHGSLGARQRPSLLVNEKIYLRQQGTWDMHPCPPLATPPFFGSKYSELLNEKYMKTLLGHHGLLLFY